MSGRALRINAVLGTRNSNTIGYFEYDYEKQDNNLFDNGLPCCLIFGS